MARKVEDIAELASQTALFGGITMVQLGNAAQHIIDGTRPTVPRLSLTSTTAMVLVFGFHAGRLAMRWQVPRLLADPPESRVVLPT